jgi:hypothetical protein
MPKPAAILTYGAPVVTLLLVVILNLRSGLREGWSSSEFLAILGVLGLLFGIFFVVQAVSRRDQKSHNAEVVQARSAFGALAGETGLTLDAPPPYQHPLGFDHAAFPEVRGTYRGRDVRIYVEYTEFVFDVVLTVGSRAGDRWPKAELARRRGFPPWLSPAGHEVARRLLAADRRPSRIDALELSPTELRCVPRDVTDRAVRIDGMKVDLIADPVDLRVILDDLILLADELPT